MGTNPRSKLWDDRQHTVLCERWARAFAPTHSTNEWDFVQLPVLGSQFSVCSATGDGERHQFGCHGVGIWIVNCGTTSLARWRADGVRNTHSTRKWDFLFIWGANVHGGRAAGTAGSGRAAYEWRRSRVG